MNNLPKVKIGIVAVSRDCFPASLAVNRLISRHMMLPISTNALYVSLRVKSIWSMH